MDDDVVLAGGPWRCKACVAELGVFTGPESMMSDLTF